MSTTSDNTNETLYAQFALFLRRGEAVRLLEELGYNKHTLERLCQEAPSGLRRKVGTARQFRYNRDVLLRLVIVEE